MEQFIQDIQPFVKQMLDNATKPLYEQIADLSKENENLRKQLRDQRAKCLELEQQLDQEKSMRSVNKATPPKSILLTTPKLKKSPTLPFVSSQNGLKMKSKSHWKQSANHKDADDTVLDEKENIPMKQDPYQGVSVNLKSNQKRRHSSPSHQKLRVPRLSLKRDELADCETRQEKDFTRQLVSNNHLSKDPPFSPVKLRDHESTRQAHVRKRMHAVDCECCREYFKTSLPKYDIVKAREGRHSHGGGGGGAGVGDYQDRLQRSSRHRTLMPRSKTPDGFWSLDMDLNRQLP
ncbi:hypothetical protein MP228_009119 [Amoeboaphelidium protococcarum]|nr:hypothetical protein MP228_009119 [Amoeboaphelidium protococcarum]